MSGLVGERPVQQVKGQQAEEDGADKADLEAPGEVLGPSAEEPEQCHGCRRHPWVDAGPPTAARSGA